MKLNLKCLLPLVIVATAAVSPAARAQTMRSSASGTAQPAMVQSQSPQSATSTTNNGLTNRPGDPSTTPAGSATTAPTSARATRLMHLRGTIPNRAYAPINRSRAMARQPATTGALSTNLERRYEQNHTPNGKIQQQQSMPVVEQLHLNTLDNPSR